MSDHEQNNNSLFSLPDDPDKLKLLVADYSRRLQNALHTIEAQKQTLLKNSIQHEEITQKLNKSNRLLELEIAKNVNLVRKKQQDDESKRYERTKIRAEKLHEEFRLATIDHQISQAPREPVRITKLKNCLAELEAKLDSQKLLLRHLSKADELVEELCQCAQSGDLQGASTLINVKGVSLHITDQSGYLPLHYAISNGHLEIVRLFLENGVDATCYLSGYSSMEIAARYGQIDCIYELLRYNISIEESGASGITDHIQLKGPQQRTSALELTMGSGGDNAGTGSGSGNGNGNGSNTPLMSAIRCSQVDCVAELINLGANIYVRDANRNNILHICSGILPIHPDANGNVVGVDGRKEKQTQKQIDANNAPLEMLKLLLSYDANIMVPLLFEENLFQQTPLRMSIANNNPELTKFLNPYYLEQNEAMNYYNSLDSTSRSRVNGGGLGAHGTGQIPYMPEYQKEAKFLAEEEQLYANRVNVNDVMRGNGNHYQPEGAEFIDLPQVTQKVATTRTLPNRTKTTMFNQAYGAVADADAGAGAVGTTGATGFDGTHGPPPIMGGNIKRSNIKPVNHFRDLATNMTTTSGGVFQAAPQGPPVPVGVGASAAIAPKGSKQAVPVGVGTSVVGGSVASASKKGHASSHGLGASSQHTAGRRNGPAGGSKELNTGSESLFNENLDYHGSVVSALTMISQHEDHDGL